MADLRFPHTTRDWTRTILASYTGLVEDDHGQETPIRFLQMLDELTACKDGRDTHIDTCIKWKMFPNKGMDEMIVETGIPFVSVCNHHVIPFKGVVHIAYIPNEYVAGLSKLARVVKHFARQLQVQERLTQQIADYLSGELGPLGVAVMIEAEHMCMTIRGVQAAGTLTTTSSMQGVFGDHSRTAKAEFLQIVRSK